MTCSPLPLPKPEAIDIPALREKYRIERERRLRRDGAGQYFRPSGEAVANYSADPHKPVVERAAIVRDTDVVIVGAGWGGILAAYYLTQEGVSDFINIDTAGDFGGVWYWNRYPGVQCDNDAYCYLPLLEETGFMPTKKFSDGAEIQKHARGIAEKFGFTDKALFHTHITSLIWDEGLKRWKVSTNRGDQIHARFVTLACGVMNMPKLPGIKGIDTFKGKLFHTARWDFVYTGGTVTNPVLDKLADKKVAIVGTGATAIQAVPHLGQYAQQLYVIQRTPSSVDERPNPPTDQDWVKSLQPGWQKERMANFHRAAMEAFHPGEADLICDIWTELSRNIATDMEAAGWPELTMEQYMAKREHYDFAIMERLRARVDTIVDDPETAEALKPYYRFLCKRPLSNNQYYSTFNRPNVELIDVSDTQGLEEITAEGFVVNGRTLPADCIIFASGFEVTSDLKRRWGFDTVQGRDGLSIYDHWSRGPRTFQGVMTHGFPNQFYIGYIQGGLNATVTEQFGQQGRHIAYIISEALKRGAQQVEPTQEAQDAYLKTFAEIEIDLSAFQSECTPSYFNNEGQANADWALFRGWGHGWQAFQTMVSDWRETGQLEGLALDSEA